MNNNEEILKKTVQALNDSEIPQIPEGLINSTVEKMTELNAGADSVEVKHYNLAERMYKMKRYGKFAIAAGVVLAVLLGVNFFPGQNGGVVWADVLSQTQQMQNMMYRISITMEGSYLEDLPKAARAQTQNMEMTVIVSEEHGMKMETLMGDKIASRMYMLPSEKAMITVTPIAKRYMRIELDDEAIDKMQKESKDPRYMASQFMESEYTELGTAVIDGIEVEGISVIDPAVFGGMYENVNLEFWADVDTGLPVQMNMDVTMAMGEKNMEMSMVMYDYQIGIELDPAQFVPDIPEDYTAMPTMQMPKKDGSSAIDGLKKFHDMAGRYPKNLNIMNLMSEIGEIKKLQREPERQARKQAREARRKARENMTEEEVINDINAQVAENNAETARVLKMNEPEGMNEMMKEAMKEMMPIMSVGSFYMTLVQEKRDPVYYGENVTPEDSDAILLRWRLDDGKYRVIFGDLDQKDVTAEQLAEWENVTQ